MKRAREFFNRNPYRAILILALLIRLVAAIFAKGYGMHDDHFCVIEPAQSWVDGTDYNNWLPQNQADPKPHGHNFFYVGFHYFLFSFLQMLGMGDPQAKMFIVRLLNGLLSLIIVACGYKITEKISSKENAVKAGLLLALFWFLPFFSVRNLVEAVSIPFLFWGVWIIYKTEDRSTRFYHLFIAGLISGVAFSLRFQTLIFIGGIGLALLFQKKWKETVFFTLGTLFSIIILQGIPDLIIWNSPFAEMKEYINYNIIHRGEYGNNKYTLYFEVIFGFLIPPVSLMLLLGFFKVWKKHLLIFLPAFLFLAFHTYFPNKQERFIYTIMPFIIMLGIIGWEEFYQKYLAGRRNWDKWINGIWKFFWITNILLLLIMTPSYSKRSRVETMYYLSKYHNNLKAFLVEDTNQRNPMMFPQFYLRTWAVGYALGNEPVTDKSQETKFVRDDRYNKVIYSYEIFKDNNTSPKPQYIIFADSINLNSRLAKARDYFPNLKYETTIRPGIVDIIVTKINPKNRNEYFYIYKVE